MEASLADARDTQIGPWPLTDGLLDTAVAARRDGDERFGLEVGIAACERSAADGFPERRGGGGVIVIGVREYHQPDRDLRLQPAFLGEPRLPGSSVLPSHRHRRVNRSRAHALTLSSPIPCNMPLQQRARASPGGPAMVTIAY